MKNVVPSRGDAPATEPGTEQMIADAKLTSGDFEAWVAAAAADANAARRG